jgi:hypothetical protein
MFLEANAAGTALGMVSGSAWAQWGAEVGVKIDGVEFMGFDVGSPGDGDQKLCSNLVWAPDVDLMPEGCLFTPVKQPMSTIDETYAPRQQFFDMCIIETARLIADLEPASEHLCKYQNWMATSSAEILKNLHSNVPSKEREFLNVPRDDWTKIMASLKWQIDETMPLSKHFAKLSLAVLENCTDIVQGRCQPLGLLMENDGLSQLYNTGTSRNYEEFLKLLGHSQPDLQIIEIGAGTGATTARALQCLHPKGRVRQYSRYVFTDISSAFFQSAMERFKGHEAVEYAVLDISQPPVVQEIEPASFDLVIASNVSLLTFLSTVQDTHLPLRYFMPHAAYKRL